MYGKLSELTSQQELTTVIILLTSRFMLLGLLLGIE